MGNGFILIFIMATCWLSLGAYMVGAFLRRFEASSSIGDTIHGLAVVLYGLGVASMALSFLMMIGSEDGIREGFGMLAAMVSFPLLVVSVQLYRSRQRRPAAY